MGDLHLSLESISKLADEFYEKSKGSLSQGDILLTKALDIELSKCESKNLNGKSLSEAVYPYFFSHYELCVVLNATCDLVHGTGRTKKVTCVQLVALSPLDDTLTPIVKRHAQDGLKFNLIDDSAYSELRDDFRKILDGQHKTRYFLPIIPFDNKHELNFPWVARLDVIISLRYDHPAAFIAARTGVKISSQRASKLAENTANLFNRIALDDVSDILGSNKYAHWVDEQLHKFCRPISKYVYHAALKDLKKECPESGEKREQKILEILEKHKDQHSSPEEQKVLAVFEKILNGLTKPDHVKSLIKKISTDQNFRSAFDRQEKIS
jgi:hypothetical protein